MTPETADVGPPKYDQIESEAFEGYLVDLIRGWAAEQFRVGFIGHLIVKDVRLAGDSFPHSEVELDTENPRTGRKFTTRYPIDLAQDRDVAKQVVSEILLEVAD